MSTAGEFDGPFPKEFDDIVPENMRDALLTGIYVAIGVWVDKTTQLIETAFTTATLPAERITVTVH